MVDRLESLRLDIVSIDPHPHFAATLLRRIQGSETMPANASTLPSVTPALHYRDTESALGWLTHTLGLTESWVHRSPEGQLQHAELRWANGLVSVNYKRGRYEQHGPTTVLLRVDTLEQVDDVYQRAVAAGGEITYPPRQDPTGYTFAVRDPEDNVWQIGTDDLDALREQTSHR